MKDDSLVGMVVADPDATLLTACENGYGKRTNFGPNSAPDNDDSDAASDSAENAADDSSSAEQEVGAVEEAASSARYRTQRRGGKGVRDIKTTERNGKVIGICRVDDDDEVLMMTARGKLQRIRAQDISVVGRNTMGVRIMSLDKEDTLTAVVRVPKEENGDAENPDAETNPDGAAPQDDVTAESDVTAQDDAVAQDDTAAEGGAATDGEVANDDDGNDDSTPQEE